DRRATSWVPPSWGEATFLPLRSDAVAIARLTTSDAPPDVEPATIRTAFPPDRWNALIAGFGPTNVASRAPEKMASTAAGPALNVWVDSFTFEPRAAAKIPFSTPTSAGACVTLGKQPRCRVTDEEELEPPPHAPPSAET